MRQANRHTTFLPQLPGGSSEHEKLCRARDQCREILKYVNEAVKQTENQHRLEGYQKRLDTTSLERASNPLAAEFKVGAESTANSQNWSRLGGPLQKAPQASSVLRITDLGYAHLVVPFSTLSLRG